MNCPLCGSEEKQSIEDTRPIGATAVRRRRRCSSCREHYTTTETVSTRNLRVVKSDGRIVPFARVSLLKSIKRATIRKYGDRELDEVVDRIFDSAHGRSDNGLITSGQIAEVVLAELKAQDRPSHVRYALVQLGRRDRENGDRGWLDADDVRAWLQTEYPDLENWLSPAQLVTVVKKDGRREKFDRQKLERSIGRAAKGRESKDRIFLLASRIARDVLRDLDVQPIVTSGQIAAEILSTLRDYDQIAYLRYASATKGFWNQGDFEAEALHVRNYHLRRDARP